MKLLLTSAGITNPSIEKALKELVGKEFAEVNLTFIPTAANLEEGGKAWLINDLSNCNKLGVNQIDIVDIAAVERSIWEKRLPEADIIVMGGGNTTYLMQQLNKSGLAKALPELLKTRVYVGISAGSIVASPYLSLGAVEGLYDDGNIPNESEKGMSFVPFRIAPHLNSPYFPKYSEESIAKISNQIEEALYALDDQSAVKMVDGKIQVISEGKWKKYD